MPAAREEAVELDIGGIPPCGGGPPCARAAPCWLYCIEPAWCMGGASCELKEHPHPKWTGGSSGRFKPVRLMLSSSTFAVSNDAGISSEPSSG